MTPRKERKTPWELIDEAASRALTRTGDIGRKGLTDVVTAGIELEKLATYIASHKDEHPGGFKGWCNSKGVVVKTCERYRALAGAWGQVDAKAKAGNPEAVALFNRLTDDGVTPTVVAAERLLNIGNKPATLKAPPMSKAEAIEAKGELTAKQLVMQFTQKVVDIVDDMGALEVQLFTYRITPDDYAEPLDRLIREATELRAKRPSAGPANVKTTKVNDKPKANPDRKQRVPGPSVARPGRAKGDMIFDDEGK